MDGWMDVRTLEVDAVLEEGLGLGDIELLGVAEAGVQGVVVLSIEGEVVVARNDDLVLVGLSPQELREAGHVPGQSHIREVTRVYQHVPRWHLLYVLVQAVRVRYAVQAERACTVSREPFQVTEEKREEKRREGGSLTIRTAWCFLEQREEGQRHRRKVCTNLLWVRKDLEGRLG